MQERYATNIIKELRCTPRTLRGRPDAHAEDVGRAPDQRRHYAIKRQESTRLDGTITRFENRATPAQKHLQDGLAHEPGTGPRYTPVHDNPRLVQFRQSHRNIFPKASGRYLPSDDRCTFDKRRSQKILQRLLKEGGPGIMLITHANNKEEVAYSSFLTLTAATLSKACRTSSLRACAISRKSGCSG